MSSRTRLGIRSDSPEASMIAIPDLYGLEFATMTLPQVVGFPKILWGFKVRILTSTAM
jgi:hypothetical protein